MADGPEERRSASIAAFSGGLDATFMALRQAAPDPAVHQLGAGVLLNVNVQGNEDRDFARLRARVLPFLESLNVEPIVVTLHRGPMATQSWYTTHAAEIASVLHSFSYRFDRGMLASTAPYDRPVVALGSSPATDYLLSGADMELVHEGAGFSRTEKAALVGTNELARRMLQVCWQGPDRAENCGVCLKCVLTRLNFIAAGHANIPAFPGEFVPEMLDGFEFHSPAAAAEFVGLLDYAAKHSITEPWVQRLRDKVEPPP